LDGFELGDVVTFVVIVRRELDGQLVDVARVPSSQPIAVQLPSLDLAISNWSA
jgi:hypothetical protein